MECYFSKMINSKSSAKIIFRLIMPEFRAATSKPWYCAARYAQYIVLHKPNVVH